MRIFTLLCLAALNFSMLFAQENLTYPSAPRAQDLFGSSTSIFENSAIVGAKEGAYLYENIAGDWIEQRFLSSGSGLVNSSAIASDWIALGSAASNSVSVFQNNAGNWSLMQTISNPSGNDEFGFGQKVELSGEFLMVTKNGLSNSVYVYRLDGQEWILDQEFSEGQKGAISGSELAVVESDGIRIYNRGTANWEETAFINRSGSIDLENNKLAIGLVNGIGGGTDLERQGEILVYGKFGNTWLQEGTVYAEDGDGMEDFGEEVVLNGNYILTGAKKDASRAGTAYLFTLENGAWGQAYKFAARDMEERGSQSDNTRGAEYGSAVAIDGNNILIGSPWKNDNGTASGAAYFYNINALPEGACTSNFEGYTLLGEWGDKKSYVSDNILNWPLAQAQAESIGGNLVTIEDQAKNQFLQSELNDLAYIGFNDIEEEDEFAWADGSPVVYSNHNRINDEYNDYAFLQFWDGSWVLEADVIYKQYVVELNCADQGELVINCPENIEITLQEGQLETVVNWSDATGSTGCDSGGLSINQESGPLSGSSLRAGTYIVEYLALDLCGNTATCRFAINVMPSPVLEDCPTNLLGFVSLGEFGDSKYFYSDEVLQYADAQEVAANNGGYLVSINSQEENTFLQSVIPRVVWIGLNDRNNEGVFEWDSGELFLFDAIAGENTEDEDNGIFYFWNGAWEFNSDLVYREFVIEIPCDSEVDPEPELTISCPQNIEVSLDPSGNPFFFAWAEPFVNTTCPLGGMRFDQTGGPQQGDVITPGVYTITYESSDACDNVAICSFTYTVNDFVLETTVQCPQDVVVTQEGPDGATVTWSAPIVTSNCPLGTTITQTSGAESGSTFPIGTTDISYTIQLACADQFGQTEFTCSFSITVEEEIVVPTDISLTCPADLILDLDPSGAPLILNWSLPNASTTCLDGGLDVVQTSGPTAGTSVGAGVYTVVYTATDACENQAECSFTITVNDFVLNTTLECPQNISLNQSDASGAPVTWQEPTVVTNCPNGFQMTQISGPDNGAVFPIGTTEVVYEVQLSCSDDFGQTSFTCSFTVTVEEVIIETNITLSCPTDIVVSIDPSGNAMAFDWADPFASTDCAADGLLVTQTNGPTRGTTATPGVYTISYSATDNCGNTESCSFTYTVDDFDLISSIVCPQNINANQVDPNGAAVSWAQPQVTTNCPNSFSIVQTSGPASGSIFPVGTTSIAYEIQINCSDDFGPNFFTCSFDVIVEQTIFESDISLVCPSNISAEVNPNGAPILFNWTVPQATSNCANGGLTTVQTSGPTLGSEATPGIYTVVYQATDACGSVETCSFIYTVDDFVLNTNVNCPTDITTSQTTPAGANVSWSEPTVTTNCPLGTSIVQTAGPDNGALFPLGTTQVSYQITLGCSSDFGQTSFTCSFSVTVQEVVQPKPDLTGSNLDIPSSVDIAQGFNFDFDLSNIGSVNVSGTYAIRSYLSTDASLNVGQDVLVSSFNESNTAANSSQTNLAVQGNVPGGTPAGNYFMIVLIDADNAVDEESEANNQVLSTTQLTVNASPQITISCPPDIERDVLPDGTPTPIFWTEPTATTQCPGGSVSLTQTGGPLLGSTADPGVYEIEYEANDQCGNTISCSFTFTMNDLVLSANVTCPEDISVFQTSQQGAQVSWGDPFIQSNCILGNTVTQTSGPTSGSFFPVGTTTVTYDLVLLCSDQFGQTLYPCSFDVTVLPNDPGAQPDLFVNNIGIPNSGTIGQPFNYDFDLSNLGTTPVSGSFAVGAYLSSDAAFNAAEDFSIGDYNQNSIAGNTTLNDIQTSGIPPNSIPPGQYFLILIADINNIVQEGNELNNFTVSSSTIQINPMAENHFENGNSSTAALQSNNSAQDKVELIRFFPNPTANYLVVELESAKEVLKNLTVYDAMGRLVENRKMALYKGENQFVLDTQDYPEGLYFIQVEGMLGAEKGIRFVKIED